MACGCNKKKRQQTQAFQLRRPDGKKTTHATRLEAEAANVRAGGGGRIVVQTRRR